VILGDAALVSTPETVGSDTDGWPDDFGFGDEETYTTDLCPRCGLRDRHDAVEVGYESHVWRCSVCGGEGVGADIVAALEREP
jgi:hypothetical protein